jgi:diguanylate cyclase (GGDEF)-like protein
VARTDKEEVSRDTASGSRGRRRRWTGVALVAGIVVAGLAGSWAAMAATERVQHGHASRLMDQHAHEVRLAMMAEANRYRDTLNDASASVGAQSDLTATDFAGITSKVDRDRLPGATGIVFAISAGDGQVAAAQAHWREHGAPELVLTAVGTGIDHLFSVFSRPLDGGVVTTGRDLSQSTEPADALRISRASRELTASHPYVLLKDRDKPAAEQQMSFVFSVPVFGGAGTPDAGRFRGWIVMGMRGADFVEETLRSQSRGAVTVTLTDTSSTAPTTVVRWPAGIAAQAGALHREQIITVGQRTWRLDLASTGTLLTATDRRTPSWTFAVAVLITLLVAGMAGILAGARNRAMDQVDQATAALRDDIRRREATEVRLRESENELRHLALHDPLTGLANRTLFYERVDHALATHSRGSATLAVLFIDLDGFKQINDNHGHSTGDAVLTEVASRLQHCMRTGDTVGRFGGDEFAVLAEQISTVDDAIAVADRVLRALQVPFAVGDQPRQISASVGVAMHEPVDETADAIIRSADEAMYQAKAAGKGRYVLAQQAPANR